MGVALVGGAPAVRGPELGEATAQGRVLPGAGAGPLLRWAPCLEGRAWVGPEPLRK